jgi:hypothetical protein
MFSDQPSASTRPQRAHVLTLAMWLVLGWCAGSPAPCGLFAAEASPTEITGITTEQALVIARRDALTTALWRAQDEGRWRSQHYAMLASGRTLGAVLLAGLLQCPDQPVAPRDRAVAFLRESITDDGSVTGGDGISEYPGYAAAFALIALDHLNDPLDHERRDALAAWLVNAQRDESDGIPPSHPAYGSWGYDRVQVSGNPGHVDLAHTRWSLTALSTRLDDDTRRRAAVFLARVQRRDRTGCPTNAPDFDGGCYFSPIVWPANKGGPSWAASYATATADGAIALTLIGQHQHAAAALGWLQHYRDWQHPAGIPTDGPEDWAGSLRFYHCMARSTALRGQSGPWREALLTALGEPNADGLYSNPGGFLMKEDDPLVASALALHALIAAAEPTAADQEGPVVVPAQP